MEVAASGNAVVGAAIVGQSRVFSLAPQEWTGTYPAPAPPPFRVSHRWDLLDRHGALIGPLNGVLEGTLSRSAAASVKASASLSLVDTGQVEDWTQVRIRPTITVNGTEWPLGVFLPDVPAVNYSGRQRLMDVALLDRTTILAGDAFGTSYGVQSGTSVTEAIREIIETTGEAATGIYATDELLLTAVESEPDDSKLAVINQLLDAGNYFSLHTDGNGRFRADPYLPPDKRPVVVEFIDGINAELTGLYLPEFTVTRDIGSVPNRVRAVSQSEADVPALVAEARNETGNEFSFEHLGFWRTLVETDVKTTSQEALQAYAERRLADASAPQQTIEIEHPPYDFTVNDVVSFESREHGVRGRFTVQNQEWSLTFDGMVSTKLRKVVE